MVGVEWLVKVIKSMYFEVTTAVSMKEEESKEFEVKVGVHQGSVLSPLLFTIVLEALCSLGTSGMVYHGSCSTLMIFYSWKNLER